MKITFICGVFPPEPAPSGLMARQLAKRLAEAGYDVTVIVGFPSRPEGVLYRNFKIRLLSRSRTPEGYTLVRCASCFLGKHRLTSRRLLENISFGLSSTLATWLAGRPDLLIIESWPLFATQLPAFVARLWRVPFLYYVKDVYPESAEVAGMLKAGHMFSRLLRSWDRHLCLQSHRVITISASMRDLLAHGRNLPQNRFIVIPDWIDEASFPVWKGNDSWRTANDIESDKFVALFAGTLGHISGADVLVAVAQLLQQESNILILCIGEGVLKDSMLAEADRLSLSNLRFLPFQPSEMVPEVQAAANIALLTMRANASDASVPSKLISYLAAARPVICAANPHSAVAQAVMHAHAGLVVPPANPQAIADAILRLSRSSEFARELGQNARSYFENHYTLDRAYQEFCEVFRQLDDAATSRAKGAPTSGGDDHSCA
jgi:colanic acid biosynthesis glycosyl transferase WcaI